MISIEPEEDSVTLTKEGGSDNNSRRHTSEWSNPGKKQKAPQKAQRNSEVKTEEKKLDKR